MNRRECLTILSALIGIRIARPFDKWDPNFLAHDMASFYNLPFEEAFTKLQAGITSEIEPLRRLGIMDLSTTGERELAGVPVLKTGLDPHIWNPNNREG